MNIAILSREPHNYSTSHLVAAAVPSRLQVESTSVAVHYIAHRQQEKQWEEEQEGQQPCRQRHVSG